MEAYYDNLKKVVVSPQAVGDMYTVSEKKLGSGAFGSVYPGHRLSDNMKVAVKYISTRVYQTPEQRYEALREPYFLKAVAETKCPHVLTFYTAHEEETRAGRRLVVVTEQAEGGELFDRVTSIQHYSERNAAKVATAMFQAVQACHDAKVIHRDLKPENVLLRSPAGSDPSGDDILIADFGLSMLSYEQSDPNAHPVGTYAYMSPEIWLHRAYGPHSDVWALGVLLYILLAGFPPFWAGENNDVKGMMARICQGAYEFYDDAFGSISSDAKDLIRSMLTVDPEKRISLPDALAHPWFKNMKEKTRVMPVLTKTITALRAFNARRKFRTTALAVMFGAMGMRASFTELANIMGGADLSDAQITELRSSFVAVAGKSAAVDFQAFSSIMKTVGLHFELTVLNRMFMAFDRDLSGTIDWRELLTGLTTLSKGDIASLRLIFNVFDADASGCISKDELGVMLSSTGFFDMQRASGIVEEEGKEAEGGRAKHVSRTLSGGAPEGVQNNAELEDHAELAALEKMFATMDANQDGKITFDEFKAAVEADSSLAQALMQPLKNIAKTGAGSGAGAAH